MYSPDHSTAVPLERLLPLLSKSGRVRELLTADLPSHPLTDMLEVMSNADISAPVGASIHDILADAIVNEGQVVWTGTRETEDDSYGFEVIEFGGVFVMRATELDDVGYFVSCQDAVNYIMREYDDVSEDE